jgi:hypothetical protein
MPGPGLEAHTLVPNAVNIFLTFPANYADMIRRHTKLSTTERLSLAVKRSTPMPGDSPVSSLGDRNSASTMLPSLTTTLASTLCHIIYAAKDEAFEAHGSGPIGVPPRHDGRDLMEIALMLVADRIYWKDKNRVPVEEHQVHLGSCYRPLPTPPPLPHRLRHHRSRQSHKLSI